MPLFDNAQRGLGGIPVVRPTWEDTPSEYPIKTLPWSAYMDATDNAQITLDGGTVETWRSSVVAQNAKAGAGSTQPFRFFLKSTAVAGSGPTINGGTANPAGTQHIAFDGTNRLQSGAHSNASQRWEYGTYSDIYGAGSDEGFWDSGTYTFIQPSPTNVPNNDGGPRFVSANSDYLYSTATLSDVFTGGGSGGLITLAIYCDAQVAPSFGTSIAQTPYVNPALISDSSGQFGIHITTSGVTLGMYDGVARDSGGGPNSNDGWQMVTAALANNTAAIVQARWGSGTIMELRVLQASGWGAWQTAAFSDIASLAGVLQLGENYDGTAYYSGIIYELSTYTTWLPDYACDDEARYMAGRVGLDISVDNAIPNDAQVIFGIDTANSYTYGFTTFTVARANDRTVGAGTAYNSKSLWQTSNYYVGLASESQSSVAKWVPNVFDGGGSNHVEITENVVDDTWALVTMRLDAGVLRARKNGDSTTDTSISLDVAQPRTQVTNQYFVMGYSPGATQYLNCAVSFFGAAPTSWETVRIRDVERYLNAVYMTAPVIGTSYDCFGMFGFFGL